MPILVVKTQGVSAPGISYIRAQPRRWQGEQALGSGLRAAPLSPGRQRLCVTLPGRRHKPHHIHYWQRIPSVTQDENF